MKPVETAPLLGLAGIFVLVLIATSGGYGYHRDELYFLEAGQHLAWGYADQPPLTPLIARLMSTIAPDSLIVLRLPSAFAAGGVVLVTGLLARDLGATRAGQLLAAACMGVSSLLLAVSHLLSTSTGDLLVWAVLSWLIVRLLRGADPRLWLLVGVVAGVGLMNKFLVIFLIVGVGTGLLIAGPRSALTSRWMWFGAMIAAVLWAPNLAWQAAHGWPQLELSRAIASGSSGTSEPVALFVPFQLVLISPVLVPVWGAGLVRLYRDPQLRDVKAFAWAYVLLASVFMATGGKPYYLGGLYPVLLAAGAAPLEGWMSRGAQTLRRATVAAALLLSVAVSATLMLPLVPASALPGTPILDINYDAGETIGWPQLVAAVADVYQGLPSAIRGNAVLLARNYGEAGALDRYGPPRGLPQAYSGHNSYWYWGPPPDDADTAIVIGYDEAFLRTQFDSVEQAARIDNGLGVDNDEQGVAVWVCSGPVRDWSALWPAFRRLG